MRIDVDCGRLAMMPQSEQVRSRSSCGKIRLRYYLRATECIPTLTKPFYKNFQRSYLWKQFLVQYKFQHHRFMREPDILIGIRNIRNPDGQSDDHLPNELLHLNHRLCQPKQGDD